MEGQWETVKERQSHRLYVGPHLFLLWTINRDSHCYRGLRAEVYAIPAEGKDPECSQRGGKVEVGEACFLKTALVPCNFTYNKGRLVKSKTFQDKKRECEFRFGGQPLNFWEPPFLDLWNGTFQGQDGEKTGLTYMPRATQGLSGEKGTGQAMLSLRYENYRKGMPATKDNQESGKSIPSYQLDAAGWWLPRNLSGHLRE